MNVDMGRIVSVDTSIIYAHIKNHNRHRRLQLIIKLTENDFMTGSNQFCQDWTVDMINIFPMEKKPRHKSVYIPQETCGL